MRLARGLQGAIHRDGVAGHDAVRVVGEGHGHAQRRALGDCERSAVDRRADRLVADGQTASSLYRNRARSAYSVDARVIPIELVTVLVVRVAPRICHVENLVRADELDVQGVASTISDGGNGIALVAIGEASGLKRGVRERERVRCAVVRRFSADSASFDVGCVLVAHMHAAHVQVVVFSDVLADDVASTVDGPFRVRALQRNLSVLDWLNVVIDIFGKIDGQQDVVLVFRVRVR